MLTVKLKCLNEANTQTFRHRIPNFSKHVIELKSRRKNPPNINEDGCKRVSPKFYYF